MLCVTTNSIDGKVVLSYRGVVAAEVVFGANLFRNVVGGRSMSYEKASPKVGMGVVWRAERAQTYPHANFKRFSKLKKPDRHRPHPKHV